MLKLGKVLPCGGNLTPAVNAVHSKSGYFGQMISGFFKYSSRATCLGTYDEKLNRIRN